MLLNNEFELFALFAHFCDFCVRESAFAGLMEAPR